jgi:SAM-dependent methyltransferase
VLELSPPSALALYEEALLGESGGGRDCGLHAVGDDGSRRPLPLDRWLRHPEPAEETLLTRAAGPVLDVGCGPGRHVAALRARGTEAVGVEISAGAAALARARGAEVIEGSIFEVELPRRWGSALLLDGNIGIGGDPAALLRRLGGLLRPGGSVLAELEPPRTSAQLRRVRLEGALGSSEWMPWSLVPADQVATIAAAAGMRVEDSWSAAGRWFAQLGTAAER